MSLSIEDMRILADITNDTFGYSSTEDLYGDDSLGGYYPIKQNTSSTTVTKIELQGDIMIAKCIAVVNLGPIGHQHQQIAKSENELDQFIKKYIADVKKKFKKMAGKALKLKIIKGSENTAINDINLYSENRRVYVNRSIAYKIG